mmetsp:Transcript_9822/g.18539  ORF Transcript_9822/g.18539 Transcript_9822/m.18539 type:complete len:309 (-) Transcript_9822:474-1400(-)
MEKFFPWSQSLRSLTSSGVICRLSSHSTKTRNRWSKARSVMIARPSKAYTWLLVEDTLTLSAPLSAPAVSESWHIQEALDVVELCRPHRPTSGASGLRHSFVWRFHVCCWRAVWDSHHARTSASWSFCPSQTSNDGRCLANLATSSKLKFASGSCRFRSSASSGVRDWSPHSTNTRSLASGRSVRAARPSIAQTWFFVSGASASTATSWAPLLRQRWVSRCSSCFLSHVCKDHQVCAPLAAELWCSTSPSANCCTRSSWKSCAESSTLSSSMDMSVTRLSLQSTKTCNGASVLSAAARPINAWTRLAR